MAEKLLHGAKPGRKVIESLDDCFKKPELDGGEEKRKLWYFYREETDEEAIIRRVKRDAFENQTKYLMCTQGVLYALCMNFGGKNLINRYLIVVTYEYYTIITSKFPINSGVVNLVPKIRCYIPK